MTAAKICTTDTFSMVELERICNAIHACKLPVLPFIEGADRGVFLRFDVDFEINAAANVAETLAGLDICATFFLLVDSPLYNVFSTDGRQATNRIIASGHRMGLHFPVQTTGPIHGHDIEFAYKTLNHLVDGAAERVVAWHNPTPSLHELNDVARRAGFISTYANTFFSPGRYLSDSNCRNTADDIISHLRDAKQTIQLLLHPEQWAFGGRDMEDVLKQLFQHRLGKVVTSYGQNRVWQTGVGDSILHATAEDQLRSCNTSSTAPITSACPSSVSDG